MKTYASLLFTLCWFAVTVDLFAQGTAFTYQGQLTEGGGPADGLYDFKFALSNAPSGGSQVGATIPQAGVGVTNGVFTTTLDFGGVFTGNALWLGISVRSNGVGSYTPLTPLQQLTPTPYAVFANMASNVSGTLTVAQLPAVVVTNNEGTVNLGNLNIAGGLSLLGTATITAGSSTLIYDNGSGSFFAGEGAGNPLMSGNNNTGEGEAALSAVTSGAFNTANGAGALNRNTGGDANTADGFKALTLNINGNNNTGVGANVMAFGTSNSYNTAIGYSALESTTNDSQLVAVGAQALEYDSAYPASTGSGFGENTAVGFQALQSNTVGRANTAIGYQAMQAEQNSGYNTAIGDGAMVYVNTANGGNTAMGAEALYATAGYYNTALGYQALLTSPPNGVTGYYNIGIGAGAGSGITNGNNNIEIGNSGMPNDNNVIRIGEQGTQATTVIAGIYGGILPSGAVATPVVVDSNGHLVTTGAGNSYSPTIGDGTHNFTMSRQTGFYTQVGNWVHFEIWIQWSAKGSAISTDAVQISLPLPMVSQRSAFPVGFVSGVSFSGQLAAGSNNGLSYLLLYNLSNSGATPADIQVSNCSATGEVQISGSYRWE